MPDSNGGIGPNVGGSNTAAMGNPMVWVRDLVLPQPLIFVVTK